MEEKKFDEKKDKKIEIVKGDGKELDISSVKDNLNFEIESDENKVKKNIIIPKNQKK